MILCRSFHPSCWLNSWRAAGAKEKPARPRTDKSKGSTTSPEVVTQPLHVSKELKQYAEAALIGKCNAVAMAEIGAQETTLSVAGLKIGRYVGSGLLDFTIARDALVNAGLQMVNDSSRSRWTRHEIHTKVVDKLREGDYILINAMTIG